MVQIYKKLLIGKGIFEKKETSPPTPTKRKIASPPTPLRKERGVITEKGNRNSRLV